MAYCDRTIHVFPTLGIITGPVLGKTHRGRKVAVARWTFEVIATDGHVWRSVDGRGGRR